MRGRRAFTLVELLVVLGIVAVLASMLMPAVSRAYEHADRAKCQNNLRQIILACSVYENESEGSIPWVNWLGPEVAGYRPPGWLYTYPHGTGAQANGTDAETGLLWQNLNSLTIFHCPQDSGPYVGGPTENLTSYLINGAICGYGRHLAGYHITALPTSAVMFWEADSTAAAWTCGAAYPSHELAARHQQGGNVGYFDGHVEWWLAADFAHEEEKLPGRLWCNPGTALGN